MIIDLLTLSGTFVALVVIGVVVTMERHRFGCPSNRHAPGRQPPDTQN